jgi:hypothetical protein
VAKSSPAPGPAPAAILEGLRKALAGPKPLLGKGEALFPAAAKGRLLAEAAVEQGYLVKRTGTVPPAGGRGKPKEVVLGELTEKGRQHVLDADSPKAVLEALLPAVQALAAGPAPGQKADGPRPELEKATQACVKAVEGAFAKLQKALEAAFARLEQAVAKATPAPPVGPPVDPGPVLAALQAALARVAIPPQAGVSPAAQPSPPAVEPSTALTAEQLRAALRSAYDHLCLFVEFRDKLVEIPRLYHEAAERLPGLSAQRFRHELEALSAERQVELHKLNEVHLAKEPELAIEKDGRLYYYVFWK